MLWRIFRECDYVGFLDHHVSCQYGCYRKKCEADLQIKAERKDKDNKYEYQANMNTLIGSLRDKLAEAVFSSNPIHRQKKLKLVVPIRPDDGISPRYENTRKSNFHHNKRSNL